MRRRGHDPALRVCCTRQRMRDSIYILFPEGNKIEVLPPSRPAASRCPPDICIKSVRIPAQIKNADTRMGICIFWQRMRDSNPRKRSQSPVCYRYTNPLSHGRDLLYARNRKSQVLFSIFRTFFSSAYCYLSHMWATYSLRSPKGRVCPLERAFLYRKKFFSPLYPAAFQAGNPAPAGSGGAYGSAPYCHGST